MSCRWVFAIAGVLAAVAVYACWCRAPLICDGAYQFDMTLAMQRPYVYLTRFHTYFFWWPTVWASRWTDNVEVLQSLFGLPFLLAPLAGLLGSWWIARLHTPRLMIWVLFGMAAGTLPGQIFVINDTILQINLFWPVAMGMPTPLNRRQAVAIGVLAVFQLSHPVGTPLLLGAAIAAGGMALIDRGARRQSIVKACVMLSLSGLAILKIVVANSLPQWRDAYAIQQADWHIAGEQWDTAVRGSILDGMQWMWAAAALVFCQTLFGSRRMLAMGLGLIALGCLARGGVEWGQWASGPNRWFMASLEYRRWAGPLTAPFLALLTVEGLVLARKSDPGDDVSKGSIRRETVPMRGPIGLGLAILFAMVFGIQCDTWHRLTDRFMAQVRAYPSVVVPTFAPGLGWTHRTALRHWAVGNYVAAMQGKQPAKVYLDPRQQELFEQNPRRWDFFLSWPDSPPGPAGWFDFRPMLRQLEVERKKEAQWKALSKPER